MSTENMDINSVSIIVSNYNAGLILTNCVTRGLNQAGEVIVVDNASTDNSLELLEIKYGNDPRLKIIRNNSNLGFSAACNIGTMASKGDYLLYLNPDALLQDNTVAKLVSSIDENTNIGMIGGLLLNPDGTEQGGGRRNVPTPWRSFVRAFGLTRFDNRWPRLFYDFYLNKQPLPDKSVIVEAISGSCMLVKRKAMQDIGLWDESYFLHCEDLDLCMRIRQKGWKILFVPDAVIIHHKGTCSCSRPIFVEWHKHKGMVRFYKKFFQHQYPGILMWLVTLGVWFRFTCKIEYYVMQRSFKWLGIQSERKIPRFNRSQ